MNPGDALLRAIATYTMAPKDWSASERAFLAMQELKSLGFEVRRVGDYGDERD